MMQHERKQETLEDILNAYQAAAANPSHTSLAEWIRRYPHFERELTEFTVSWSLIESFSPALPPASTEEPLLHHHSISLVQDILRKKKEVLRADDQEELHKGICQEGAVQGLSIHHLAERSQLSVALVRKLDRRLIQYRSIPKRAIEYLAQAIHRDASTVARYLQGAPILPQEARYRSEQAPKLTEAEDFFEAVRNDGMMTEALRQYWLVLAPGE
jgi:hypothetical protein